MHRLLLGYFFLFSRQIGRNNQEKLQVGKALSDSSPYHKELPANGLPDNDNSKSDQPKEIQATEKCPILHQTRVMRAARLYQLGDFEHIKVEEDVPVLNPGENEVLIRIFTIGVNPVDARFCKGSSAHSKSKVIPFVIGASCAGIIEMTGAKVKKFTVGERVYASHSTSGTYANYMVTKASWIHRLHDKLSFSQGAALGVPYHTAFKSLFKIGKSKAGDAVLVHGACGGIEIACCQLGRAYGVRVVVTADTDQSCHLLRENGALLATKHTEDHYVKYLKAITRDEGYDLIIEAEPHKHLCSDIGLLKQKGKIVIIGGDERAEINFEALMAKEARIYGFEYFNETDEESKEISAALYAGMDEGWLKPVIADEFPLSAAVEALSKAAQSPSDSPGSIIMSPV